jgi:hypothetical protein
MEVVEEKSYASGFNTGYILAEFEPQILDSILKNIQSITPFIDGLKYGQIEYQHELMQNRINAINQLKSNNPELDREHE